MYVETFTFAVLCSTQVIVICICCFTVFIRTVNAAKRFFIENFTFTIYTDHSSSSGMCSTRGAQGLDILVRSHNG